jgi:hypothetical protein
VDIAPYSYNSPTTKAAGGIEFDPIAAGTTVISSNVNGFNNIWSGVTQSVVVQ